MKPCENCIRTLEGGAHALWEMIEFTPEALPPLPEKFESWRDLQQFLIKAAAHARLERRKQEG